MSSGPPAPHGTHAAYNAGCRCLQCGAACAAYQKERREKRAAGEAGLVDAGPARAHCFKLRAMNIGYAQIAALAAVSPTTVLRLCSGVSPVVQRRVADKVLAVRAVPALGARIVAHDTWRIVRLLRKELYTDAELAKMFGLKWWGKLRIGRKRCTVRTAAMVRREYLRARPESTEPKED